MSLIFKPVIRAAGPTLIITLDFKFMESTYCIRNLNNMLFASLLSPPPPHLKYPPQINLNLDSESEKKSSRNVTNIMHSLTF